MDELRRRVIKVAYDNPGEVREALLPLLKEAIVSPLVEKHDLARIAKDVKQAAKRGKWEITDMGPATRVEGRFSWRDPEGQRWILPDESSRTALAVTALFGFMRLFVPRPESVPRGPMRWIPEDVERTLNEVGKSLEPAFKREIEKHWKKSAFFRDELKGSRLPIKKIGPVKIGPYTPRKYPETEVKAPQAREVSGGRKRGYITYHANYVVPIRALVEFNWR